MRRTQKFLSVFLAIMMVLSIIPITASAAPDPYSGTCGDNLTWSFEETTGTLTISGEGVMYDFPFDDSQWFDLKSEITNVVIEDGVTSIGDSAFELFVNLKNVTIPESVTSIGAYAFDECDSITKIVLHEGVTKIGDGAFSNCDYLDTVVIPGTVTEFGDYVFAHCDRLANVTLCDGLTDIGLDTFAHCTSLTDIVIPEGVTSLRGENFAGCVNLKSITFPVSVTSVGYGVFGDCVNLQDVYYTGTEEDILNLHPSAYNAPLLAANIHCESTVHRHNYVKTNEYVAEFCDEDGYTTYTCECGHTYNGDYVKAKEHSYDNGVVTTNPTCDADGVKTFTCTVCGDTYTEAVPQTGHSYDDGVITTNPTCIADGVKTFTCGSCGDTYTEVVKTSGEHDYQLVPNTSPDTGCVKTYKCSGCGDTYTETVNATGHTQVIIPALAPTETKSGLTAGIACSDCGAILLKQEIIPAFGTTEDASVIVSGTCGTNATWTYNTETGALIISGTGATEKYTSTQNRPWVKYEDEIKTIVINSGITKIDSYAFKDCSNLLYVSIPDSVTSMGSYIFKNCKSLTSVTIPDSVTSIGLNVFENCNKLIDVTISNVITLIEAGTFKGCSSLIHVTVPDSVYYIYFSAFENCSNLKSVTVGKNLDIVHDKAFNGCTALTDVYYVGTEEQWKDITIGTDNTPLTSATIHYNSTGSIGGTEHKHNYKVYTLDPTCTEKGYTSYSCECGYEYIVYFDALGHSEEEIPPVLPTSSKVGYTRGKKCTTCGETFVEPVVVPIISETARAGDAGYNIIWTYDEATQTMEFFGKGNLKYYDPVVYASNESDERPWAIYRYSLVQYVIVHEGIKGLNEQNFYYFTGLKLISLPSSLEWIGDDVFEGCENFYIKYNGTNEEWNKIDGHFENNGRIIFNDYNGVTASGTHGDNLTWTYDGLTSTLTISGTGAMESVAYNEYPWYEYISEIETIIIKKGVTTIGDGAFRGYDNCTNITISSSVTEIGDNAFYPDNIFKYKTKDIYYLGTEEMWNNISMGSFNILLDDNYSTIHFVKYAGYCGHNLTYSFDGSTLTISGTGDMCEFDVDYSGDIYSPWADWALEIEHIVIGDGITSISDDAFSSCGTKLQTVTFGSDVKKIGAYAFYWCKSLTEIIFPDGLTVIGKYAFYNSTSLKTVVLPESIEEISVGAFCDCTGITDVHYQGTESQWDEIIIDSKNNELINARIHYNYTKPFTGIKDDYFYKEDVKQKAYQLVEFEGDFYFINNGNKIAKNTRIYLSQRFVEGFTFADGTPLTVGYYDFDEEGKMIILNGPAGDYFYKNNERLKAYQLVEYEGDFYFINDSHKLAKNKRIYLSERFVEGFTYADGTPLQPGYYMFDIDGKMAIINGTVGDYFYKNNVRLNAYQLVEYQGEFYFINDSHKIAKNKTLYLSEKFVDGFTYEDGTPLKAGYYTFDEYGRMVMLNGPVGDYFYENNVRLKAYQLVEFEGDYYFINDSHKLAKNTRLYLSERFVEGTDLEVGWYNFDADGKLVIE